MENKLKTTDHVLPVCLAIRHSDTAAFLSLLTRPFLQREQRGVNGATATVGGSVK